MIRFLVTHLFETPFFLYRAELYFNSANTYQPTNESLHMALYDPCQAAHNKTTNKTLNKIP